MQNVEKIENLAINGQKPTPKYPLFSPLSLHPVNHHSGEDRSLNAYARVGIPAYAGMTGQVIHCLLNLFYLGVEVPRV